MKTLMKSQEYVIAIIWILLLFAEPVFGQVCPTIQASNFRATIVNPQSVKICWTRGNGNQVLVVARKSDVPEAIPVDSVAYKANSEYGAGSGLSFENFVVYNGVDSQVIVTNLLPDISYSFSIYEYLTDSCYLVPALVGTATTHCSDGASVPFVERFNHFSGSIPPCWTSFSGANGLGVENGWIIHYSFVRHEGEAQIFHEAVTGGLAEDWLVTPQINIPDGPTFSLNFFEMQASPTTAGSDYYVKISTTSQTDRSTFSDLIHYDHTQVGNVFRERSIDLSSYAGKSVYIALVMSQNGGNDWYIDNFSVEATPQRTNTLWTGAVSSDWNTVSNWQDEILPEIYKNVTIPANCPHYPVIGASASCRNLSIQDGAEMHITTGADFTIIGNLAVGNGTSGSFKIDGGICKVTGDFLTEKGCIINILGGTFSFVNWKRNQTNPMAEGTIVLSGGTINAAGDVFFSPTDISGTMNGPFLFNVGGGFMNSDSTWTTVTDGTIIMNAHVGPGDMTHENASGGFFSSNATTYATAYNLVMLSNSLKFYFSPNIIIKNNFTISANTRISKQKPLSGVHVQGDFRFKYLRYNPNVDFYIGGNWINETGVGWFIGSNTVYMVGNDQIIYGFTAFYNLTKKCTRASTLTFSSNIYKDLEQTPLETANIIHGTLTLQGAPGQLLSLRSTTDGVPWEINPEGARKLSYLDVKDSKNVNAKIINACSLVDSGNNSGWDFTNNGPFPLAAGPIIGADTVCRGVGNIIYSVPDIADADSYIWTLPSGATGTSSTNNISVNYDNTATAGEIKVKGSNACGNGPESALIVKVDSIPAEAGPISGRQSVCQGVNNVKYKTASVAGANSYYWNLPEGYGGNSTVDSISVNFADAASSGEITVKGNNHCGFGKESKLLINVDSVPAAAGEITGNQTVCVNKNNLAYSVASINGATSYIWEFPAGFYSTDTTGSILVNTGNDAISGYIKVKGHNVCGEGIEKQLQITVNQNCNATSVGNISDDKMRLYPNPTTGQVDIHLNEPVDMNCKIEVYNGLHLMQTSLIHKNDQIIQLDLTGFPDGIYIIKIYYQDKSCYYKVIKN